MEYATERKLKQCYYMSLVTILLQKAHHNTDAQAKEAALPPVFDRKFSKTKDDIRTTWKTGSVVKTSICRYSRHFHLDNDADMAINGNAQIQTPRLS